MPETFAEEVVVTHNVPNPKGTPLDHPGGPPATLVYSRITLVAEPGHVVAGGEGGNGRVTVATKDGKPTAELIAADNEAVIAAGQKAHPGRLTLYDGSGHTIVNLTAGDAHAVVGGGADGRITAAGKDGQPTVELVAGAKESVIAAGQTARPGRLTLYDGKGHAILNLTAADAHGAGRITVAGSDGQPLAELIAADKETVIAAGNTGRPGRLSVYDGTQKETIRLDGAAGDIVLYNADCAEEFAVADLEEVQPGTVMVLGEAGELRPSDRPYDTRVVGVASGAGGLRPGLVLDRKPGREKRMPIALVGKVFCMVDADLAAVATGDLLTTAATRGHAMKVTNPARAFGSVLGKALHPLGAGRALIPILVALQ
jgi:hypothetical protein